MRECNFFYLLSIVVIVAVIAIARSIRRTIIDTAQTYEGDTSMGCFSGAKPSNAFGYGVVDVYAAVKKALGK